MTTYKAVLVTPRQNARVMDKQELVQRIHVVAIGAPAYDGATMHGVVEARFYMGKSNSASVVTCALWARIPGREWHSGTGRAGGYGYHRNSAALDSAISSAGIELYDTDRCDDNGNARRADIRGVGESAMREALQAIARAAGYAGELLVIGD